ncbi:MAG TPA: hypothetical protein VK753_04230 [Xanthomonadaceae bacterium]|jgi:hypothetical protein|nr:hypothetical protein [Xanthomonadaceae bacterium]
MNGHASPIPLSGLRFKGDRDYLHGTDILPIALQALSGEDGMDAIGEIDITFHGLATTGLTLCADAPHGSEPKVQLSCSMDGAKRRIVLVEDGRPIAERHPYPEERIVAATDIDVPSATAVNSGAMPFTNIERWVAMVKALHQAVYPGAKGKWLFARGRFARYQEAYAEPVEHRVTIQASFGDKLTRSALTIDGQPLGDIYFVLT